MRPFWGLTIVLLALGLLTTRPVLAQDATLAAPTPSSVIATPSTVIATPSAGVTTPVSSPAINLPLGGAALQGQIAIVGVSAAPDFVSAEVSFAYSQIKTQAWYPIGDSTAPVTNGPLANWDTTTITDGTYDLRLAVTLKDGSQKVAVVKGLRVRNYTPVETATPTITPTSAPVLVTATPTPTIAPTAVRPEPTPLPTNPAAVSQGEIDASFLKGMGVVGLLFASVGLYLILRARMVRP